MAKKKYYVVWQGAKPGVYHSWETCQEQTLGFKDARYKSYLSIAEAEAAFKAGFSPASNINTNNKPSSNTTVGQPIMASLSVDAACSGNPGVMEYQGVNSSTKEVIFHQKFPLGTNNIGEFLALVHGISLVQKNGWNFPIYTDSITAMAWVRKKKCGSKLAESPQTNELFKLIARAEKWLAENTVTADIRKWETEVWGEIPADFGRK